jgi:hypothetical protein
MPRLRRSGVRDSSLCRESKMTVQPVDLLILALQPFRVDWAGRVA